MTLPPWSLWLDIDAADHSRVRLWLPLFLLWLLLLPFVVLALMLAVLADVVLYLAGRRYHSYTLLLFGGMDLVAALRGLVVRVHNKDAVVDVIVK